MSSMPGVIDRPDLEEDAWVDFRDFDAAVAAELARENGTELTPGQADIDFAALLNAQERPFVETAADRAALQALLGQHPPQGRPLPPRLHRNE
jgi:hypothetical protein